MISLHCQHFTPKLTFVDFLDLWRLLLLHLSELELRLRLTSAGGAHALALGRCIFMSEKSRGRSELERVAGCDKRRPPADLSWLFSQVSKAGVGTHPQNTHVQEENASSSLFQVLSGGTEGVSILDQQTYGQWKSFMGLQKLSHPRRLRRSTIILQPFTAPSLPGYSLSEVAPVVLQQLQKFCSAFFSGMTLELAPPLNITSVPNLASRVHPSTSRTQYLVGDILAYLQRCRPRHAQCVMGVATVDLYPSPEWNFVLGHASLTSGCGIFGFGRYFSSQFSTTAPTVQQQLGQLWVLARVVTHELCHTLGMKHCYYFHCAMNESTSIQQAATQPLFLCPVCLRKLKKWLRFDILTRYSQMKEAIEEMIEVVKEANPELIKEVDSQVSVSVLGNYHTLQELGESHLERKTSESVSVVKQGPINSSLPQESVNNSLPQLLCLQEACQWLDSARESASNFCQKLVCNV